MISWQKTTVGLLIVAAVMAISWTILGIDLEAPITFVSLLSSVIGMLFVQIPEKSFGFSCGHRIKQIRQEIDIQPSEVVELFNLDSESEYINIEVGRADAPKVLIARWCDTFGVNPDWLKHGSSLSMLQKLNPINVFYEEHRPKYIRKTAEFYKNENVRSTIEEIFRTEPESLYLCIDPENCGALVLAIEYGDHCWNIWDINSLDFWQLRWQCDVKYIPYIYDFIKQLGAKAEYKLHGLFATRKQILQLYSGNCYPGNVIRSIRTHQYKKLGKRYSNIRHWPEDMLDLSYRSSSKDTYQSWYGEWFIEVQHHFREAKLKNNSTR